MKYSKIFGPNSPIHIVLIPTLVFIILWVIVWGSRQYSLLTSIEFYCLHNSPHGAASYHGRIISFLEWLIERQEQFKRDCLIDQDADGVGEYGHVWELSDVTLGRCGRKVNVPYIGPVILVDEVENITRKGSYYIQTYIPSNNEINLQENYWIYVAWPRKYKKLAECVFIVNQEGQIYCCKNNIYKFSGLENPPNLKNLIPNWKRDSAKDFNMSFLLENLSKLEEWVKIKRD
jgi:hypothetical protein